MIHYFDTDFQTLNAIDCKVANEGEFKFSEHFNSNEQITAFAISNPSFSNLEFGDRIIPAGSTYLRFLNKSSKINDMESLMLKSSGPITVAIYNEENISPIGSSV